MQEVQRLQRRVHELQAECRKLSKLLLAATAHQQQQQLAASVGKRGVFDTWANQGQGFQIPAFPAGAAN